MLSKGDKFINNKGYTCTVVDYKRFTKVGVRYEEGTEVYYVKGAHLKSGNFKSPFERSVANTGFLGEGGYVPKINADFTKNYCVWRDMIHRCYNVNMSCYSSYGGSGVMVCDDWHNFQVFSDWFKDNYKDGQSIDKDLFGDGKLYSAETCCFIPKSLNSLIKRNYSHKGKTSHLQGVHYVKRKNTFSSGCYDHRGSFVNLGYGSEGECYERYVNFKSEIIRESANMYLRKGDIDTIIYDKVIEYSYTFMKREESI